MVGIVIVSHSRKLAEGVAELARGMAGPDVRIAATGGLDLPDNPLGTDAHLVLDAIRRVYENDGVIVLVDLGSAVLSTELALEQLEPEEREHVVLSDAPLVEGANAAAVQARLGGTLEQVAAEAHEALRIKRREVQGDHPPPSAPSPTEREKEREVEETLVLLVRNPHGLHARPAAEFVKQAARFEAEIEIENVTARRGPANAKSITSVLAIGVSQGSEIRLTARGHDAEEALEAMRELIESAE